MSRISRILLAATFAAAVAICEVAAQQSSDPSNSSPANAASATKASAGRTVADTQFIKEAAEGGMAEVALGQLAVEKASSGDVKKFGQRMVDDHSKANDELKQLAAQKAERVPKRQTQKWESFVAVREVWGNEYDKCRANGTLLTVLSASCNGAHRRTLFLPRHWTCN